MNNSANRQKFSFYLWWIVLLGFFVGVFPVILSAGVPAQEKLALPDDPLAAIARMPVQEPAVLSLTA